MELADNLHELRKATGYVLLRRMLRSTGIAFVVVGSGYLVLFALVFLLGKPETVKIALYGGFPFFLLLYGILMIKKPDATWFYINIVLTAALLTAMGIYIAAMTYWIVLLAVPVILIRYLLWWKSYYKSLNLGERPSIDIIIALEQLVRNLLKAKPSADSDIIRFYKRMPDSPILFTFLGKLLEDGAVFFRKKPKPEILIARKEEVSFSKRKEELKSGRIPTLFEIGGQRISGFIEPGYFTRYEAWKAAGDSAADNA